MTMGLTASPVHPRVCGEHSSVEVGFQGQDGSSPRVRGTRAEIAQRLVIGRFIPACAGNTPAASCRMSPCAVHPRVCGEHIQCFTQIQGSIRFIPACAGNTLPGTIWFQSEMCLCLSPPNSGLSKIGTARWMKRDQIQAIEFHRQPATRA